MPLRECATTFQARRSSKSALPLHMRLLFADGLFWTSVACCLIAQLLIIRSVRGARYVPEPSSTLPRRHGVLEMVWAVVPAIGLAALLLFTWRAIHVSRDASHEGRRFGANAASVTRTAEFPSRMVMRHPHHEVRFGPSRMIRNIRSEAACAMIRNSARPRTDA